MKIPPGPNISCSRSAPVIGHGFYKTNSGRRRRYRCSSCGRTFCSSTRTAYHRLQHRRSTFDEVAALSVEGLNKSAIARVKGLAWNTVDRWLEKAATFSRQFNDEKIRDLPVAELQVDEIRTFCGDKKNVTWIFTSIEVWSRLWPVALIGRRSYTNTRAVMRDVRNRMTAGVNPPLVVTDGFDYYPRVVREVFGPMGLFGQVIKTRRHDRVIKVERRQIRGTKRQFDESLSRSEDSYTLNTSFVERLNLTIRQGSAYLARRTLAHSRWSDRLDDHVELLRCHYNFLRPHRALKFGREIRTPAMQAGLAKRRLTFRDIFSARLLPLSSGRDARASNGVSPLGSLALPSFVTLFGIERLRSHRRWRKHRPSRFLEAVVERRTAPNAAF